MSLELLADYLPYTPLVELALFLALLLLVAGIMVAKLLGRIAQLQDQCDLLRARYERSEEQLRTVWQKEA